MSGRSCNRKMVPDSTVDNVMRLFRDKLNFVLDKKGNGSFASRHELNGIIEEEFDELKKISHDEKSDLAHYEEELFDIGIACIFGVASIQAEGLEW